MTKNHIIPRLPANIFYYFQEGTASSRNEQHLLGRDTARNALLIAGLMNPPIIGRGEGGEPLWPEGICGSISHTEGAALALVARSADYCSLGVDLELRNRIIRENTHSRIATTNERAWIEECADKVKDRTLLVFTAKEAIYKAIYPLCRKFIGYQEVELRFEEKEVLFECHACGATDSLPDSRFTVVSHITDKYIISISYVTKINI